MKQPSFHSGSRQTAGTTQAEMKRLSKRTRLFSSLAHDSEYEGEDVHLGSEAITVFAV